ncbi:MAG: glycosyltransferase [Syntrophobacterales bacterium]|jgi:spore maturation protein CgeB
MNYWEKNYEILKQQVPDLAETLAKTHIPADHQVLPSKTGLPSLKVGRQQLHSAYDPLAEGLAWVQAQDIEEAEPLVIFGLGLGYHVLPLLEAGREVWVVEPSAAVARLALEHQDLTPLWAQGGLRLGRDFQGLPPGARLLAHPPSRRLHPGLYQRLAAHLRGESGAGAYLRILVVGPLYGGSHPIARSCARAFSALGHQAELLDYAPFYQGYQILQDVTADKSTENRLTQELLTFLGEILVARVRDFRPDLVFLLAQAPVEPRLLRRLSSEGPLLAYWFVEAFQVFPYWRDLAPEVDVFFTIQREPFFRELSELGPKNFAFLPLAADPEVYRPLNLTPEEIRQFGAAVSFVGAGYRNRREFFPGLLDFDFRIWGSDWNLNSPLGPFIQNHGARVSEEEAVKIFNASRINLNLHSSPYHLAINPEGDYVNPRTFDLAAAGAFQLVDPRAQLSEFFQPEEEVALFHDLTEARDKIAFYLSHGEECIRMARQGRKRCLRDHTYNVRLEQALDLIADLCPGKLPQRSPPEKPLEQLRRGFPADHPVQAMLQPVPPEVEDLSQLVDTLRERDEPLTESEAIFWLLHEFQQGLERGRF